MSLTRVVRMTFRPEEVDTFRRVFEESKHRIRASEGCLHLELWQDAIQSNVWMTFSQWTSEEALERYRQSELFRSTWARTKILFAEKPLAFSVHSVETLPQPEA